MWRAVATGSGAGVVLMHDAHGRFLRADWRSLPCRAGVAVGDDSCLGPTTKWAVEVIPPKHGQPELPLARDVSSSCPPGLLPSCTTQLRGVVEFLLQFLNCSRQRFCRSFKNSDPIFHLFAAGII